MNSDEARKQAGQLFRQPNAHGKVAAQDYEARARDIRQKIEYLRSLRMAAQARQKITREQSSD
jgi:hypothetical protein